MLHLPLSIPRVHAKEKRRHSCPARQHNGSASLHTSSTTIAVVTACSADPPRLKHRAAARHALLIAAQTKTMDMCRQKKWCCSYAEASAPHTGCCGRPTVSDETKTSTRKSLHNARVALCTQTRPMACEPAPRPNPPPTQATHLWTGLPPPPVDGTQRRRAPLQNSRQGLGQKHRKGLKSLQRRRGTFEAWGLPGMSDRPCPAPGQGVPRSGWATSLPDILACGAGVGSGRNQIQGTACMENGMLSGGLGLAQVMPVAGPLPR